ncbi:MobA/MobL family protein [Stenotrophomonas rhizophila]|uniref:MobA/MobL family protein n=1 Tax=Stenotrophomonas rhizophila TaxID=216778 RepID=A0A498CS10_9GAMM|nr:MobA/MobL family protein [Stenotrophomonas rhizophila]RLK56372.1 MobA/MobL family protein [Stenotrophomonas rhizophila]
MTIEHTRIKTYSRAKGHSALAAAAYRGGFLLIDPKSGAKHDYRGRAGIIQACFLAPPGSPAWVNDPQRLWAAVEAAERRRNSTVCRDFTIALPHELDDRERWDLVLDISHALIERYGFALQASHHRPTKDDPRYFYAHLLVTTRRMEASGLAAKTRVLDGRINGYGEVLWIRAMISGRINAHRGQSKIQVEHEPQDLAERLAMRRGEGSVRDEQASFEQLLGRYRKEGKLLPVPVGHTAERARREQASALPMVAANATDLPRNSAVRSPSALQLNAGMCTEAAKMALAELPRRQDSHRDR